MLLSLLLTLLLLLLLCCCGCCCCCYCCCCRGFCCCVVVVVAADLTWLLYQLLRCCCRGYCCCSCCCCCRCSCCCHWCCCCCCCSCCWCGIAIYRESNSAVSILNKFTLGATIVEEAKRRKEKKHCMRRIDVFPRSLSSLTNCDSRQKKWNCLLHQGFNFGALVMIYWLPELTCDERLWGSATSKLLF